MKRTDDFEIRREHLANLSDEALKEKFWALTDALVAPLLELGRENTSPAIERSVLLRMGFSSLEAKPIVEGCMQHGLLAHGAGNVVYRVAQRDGVPIREAGLSLCTEDAWENAEKLFHGGAK